MTTMELVGVVEAGLEPLDAAKRRIARAIADGDADLLIEVRARGAAYELHATRAGAMATANDAGEIKVRAERGLALLDVEAAPHGGDKASSGPSELAPLATIDKDARPFPLPRDQERRREVFSTAVGGTEGYFTTAWLRRSLRVVRQG